MTTLFSDNFNRADGVPGANWDANTDAFHNVVSNELVFSSGGGPMLTDVAAHAAAADVRVSFTIASAMASFDAGVCARADFNETGSTGAGYILDVFDGTYDVYRRFNGSNTVLRSTSATTAEGDVWMLEVSGTGATVTIKIYRNGVQQGADITDTSGSRITAANRTGVYSWVAGSTYDNFLVEDLAAGSAPTLSSPTPSGTIGTQTTATIGATTTETNGTFYVVVDTGSNLSGVTAAEIKAGQRAGGAAALKSGNVAVSTTTPSVGVTGLTAATAYVYAAVHNNPTGDSNIVSGSFTTAAATPQSAPPPGAGPRIATLLLT